MQKPISNAAAGSVAPTSAPLLSIEHLRVVFPTETGLVHAVQDVSLRIWGNETLSIVGESGSGKSMTALAILGLVPPTAVVSADNKVEWQGEPIDLRGLERLRGSEVTMVFQDPMSSLNPLKTVGEQVAEVLRHQRGMSHRAAVERTAELFEIVGIPDPKRRLRQYPFEFSGGMAQRVMIAIALAPEGSLLIADEPTTALDVTIQAQILELIAKLRDELGLAVLLISHDLGVVAGIADRIAVMYAGRIVEEGNTRAIFKHPRHPYTAGLIASTPHPYKVQTRLEPIAGNPPTIQPVVPGCAFADRCPRSTMMCRDQRPPLEAPTADGDTWSERVHTVACWHAL